MNTGRQISAVKTAAENLVAIWSDHKLLLRHQGLSYIDSLIDAAVNTGVLDKAALRMKLAEMIPGMPLGTARRLVDLKYPHISEEQKLHFLQRR